MENIQRRLFLDPELSAVQETVASAVEKDPNTFIERYLANPLAHGGRYINADLFKETIPVYAVSNAARTRYNGVVHNSAAVLSSELFKRVVTERPIDNEKDSVVFLTGIPGAGKTTSVLAGGSLPENVHTIFEGQLARPESSFSKFDAILKAGLKPVIVAVHANPEIALANTLKRFEKVGRGASLSVMADIQGGLADGLTTLYQQYGDKVSLKIVDVRIPDQAQELVGWEHLPLLRSEGQTHEIKERLGNKLDQLRNDNAITDSAYRQAAGADYRPDRSLDSKGISEQKADDYRSGLSRRNRVEDFLNLDPKEALKHHPELGNVYQILKLIENQAKQDGHSAANVAAIVNQTKVELAGRLQKGGVPAVKHEKEVNKPVIEDERGH